MKNIVVCSYGCDQLSNFILKNGKACCSDKSAKCPSVRKKNSESLKLAHKNSPNSWKNIKLGGFTSNEWKINNPEKYKESLRKRKETKRRKYESGELIHSWTGRKHSLETKQKISNSMSARNNGLVKTKWFKIFSPFMQEVVAVQGTWEFKYATYLNEHNISWIRTRKIRLRYKLSDEDYLHNYFPDFYLPQTDEYIEIKGYFWKSKDGRVDDVRKLEKVVEYNKDKKINILKKEDLKLLGINLTLPIDAQSIKIVESTIKQVKQKIKVKNVILKNTYFKVDLENIAKNIWIKYEIDYKKKQILESKINFTKQGWVNEVSRILEITPQNVNRWMKRNMKEFYQTECKRRKLQHKVS